MNEEPYSFLGRLFHHAIQATHPKKNLHEYLPARPQGRLLVCALGKAAHGMAKAAEDHYGSPLEGIVVAPFGSHLTYHYLKVMIARHPVPDASCVAAATAILAQARSLTADDRMVFLVSGGGSALACMPADGITLEEKQTITQALLRSGAPVSAINCVRRHLSGFKGGKLAMATSPASCTTLALSDVPGDDPLTIASGPTVQDPTTSDTAIEICKQYHIPIPPSVARHLEMHSGWSQTRPATDADFVVVAKPADMLEAARIKAQSAGMRVIILGDRIEGEARAVAQDQAMMALKLAAERQPSDQPVVILSGGETSVTLHGKGKGGRNGEFILSLALHLKSASHIHAMAADTDGRDGTGDNAGAFCGPETLSNLAAKGLDANELLQSNDALTAFTYLGDTFMTGDTGTNLNDFRAILIGA